MPDETVYLTVKDIANRLQVSEQTVWRWIRSGELPSIKLGGQYRVSPDDLQDFLKKHRKQPPG
jgi:excisionase family DNA binding protein